jgi:DNA-binding MarR family transcriptional regulator
MTQRSAAREVGIALGLANAYLKRCVKKGLIKVAQAPANRYAYYLTPKGFAEKSRLTSRFLSQGFLFFREARQQYSALFEHCAQRGWTRVALWGLGDLAEIAVLCASEHPVELAGVISPMGGEAAFKDLAVARGAADLGRIDAIVVTDFNDPQWAFDTAVVGMARDRVLAPEMLNVSRQPPPLVE